MATLDFNDSQQDVDQFMVYGFKVLPCCFSGRHDWRECPYAHSGEVARRRDPRLYNYVGIICPDAKKKFHCPRGDRCPYTHNLFEYWLHPTRYKTELCSRGRHCSRPFCFFAHSELETRAVDINALMAVFERPTELLSLDDSVSRTADLLQNTQFFAPSLRTQFVPERHFVPDHLTHHTTITKDRLHDGYSPRMNSSHLSATQWETPSYAGSRSGEVAQNDCQRRDLVTHFDNASDVISKLGKGYLQKSAHHRQLLQELSDRMLMRVGDFRPQPMPAQLATKIAMGCERTFPARLLTRQPCTTPYASPPMGSTPLTPQSSADDILEDIYAETSFDFLDHTSSLHSPL